MEGEGLAKASGRDLRISPKATREICRAIRNMRLGEARTFLQDVMAKKRAVPYRRYNKEVSHKTGLQGWYAGKYPMKAAGELLKILNSLEANADVKGLDLEKLELIHAAAHRGRNIKRFIQRAFGRSSPKFDILCHVEFAVKEKR
ncbi:50S ribosomal protein L22 [Candidatus Bathyarchaeota archaeon]|nr:50S ribosomal protein L22 [Candidatus Bathyarchaeota archaeon]